MKLSASMYLQAGLRGAGQVIFQRSSIAGGLFLAAILAGSLGVGGEGHVAVFVGALAALILATVWGFITRYEGSADGLAGFNAVLTGCAAYTFLSVSLPAWMLIIAAVITVPMKRLLDRAAKFTKTSSLTLPFILAMWLLIYVAGAWGVEPYVPESIVETPELTAVTIAEGWLKGLSEIFLIDSWVAGLLILVGLWVANPQSAIFAAMGSAAGMAFALAAECPAGEIAMGLWGFSPALTAVAVGVTFRPKFIADAMWGIVTLFASIFAGLFQLALMLLLTPAGLPVLTLPFCLATWLVIWIAHDLHTHPHRYRWGRILMKW